MFDLEPRLYWQGEMSEYVSAIAWTNDGNWIAIADAAGRICRVELATLAIDELQPGSGQSIDCLAFSANDEFLAASGQAGAAMIWRMQPQVELITVLEYSGDWIDRLVWHPTASQLAFQAGFDLHVWDTGKQSIVTTLPIGATAQDLQWHPQGHSLTLAANNQLLTWSVDTWEQTSAITLVAPATSIAWSKDGTYLALGNLERHLFLWEWGSPDPWRMQGFPGKVSQLAWSASDQLAVSSLEGIVLWERSGDNWQNQIFVQHQHKVMAIAFRSGDADMLASAARDESVLLWQKGEVLARLEGAPDGFSSLAWQPQGDYLIAGGVNGELCIWAIGKVGPAEKLTQHRAGQLWKG